LLFDKQVFNTWLAMFSREFFVPSSQQNSEKIYFAFAQHFPSWEARLSAPCVFKVCLVQPRQRRQQLGKILPLLSAEEDPPPHTLAAAAHPHPSAAVCPSILTWCVLYSTLVVATTFSGSLIAYPSGWKQLLFLKHPRRHVHML
jgi:hypothetical protein